ncbi:DUF2993 domain-containing protein [Microbacterium sp. ASV49]|uniref:LmeA family phospholipid-binding protein n=1 Tax=Microbacterium candidum TaxID=3041922 RepID=A0ABT7N179_9MICO|nr:LmeA family phospholipid-binding protein [Microbacterium sp. ASV49]MDL9980466.1 LmeA family phospholipid-binding protein [Microbacterium sp. ASV49]
MPEPVDADHPTIPIERIGTDAASTGGAESASPTRDAGAGAPAWAGHDATARQPIVPAEAGPATGDAASGPAESAAEPEATTLPLPVVGAPPSPPETYVPTAGAPPKPPKARRRGRAALIWTLAVVVVLGIAGTIGWFAGEAWAEKAVTSAVQQQTAKALGISDPQTVKVGLTDPVLPQVIAGTLTTLDVAAPNIPIGGASGTVTLHATGVPTGGGQPSSATASVSMSPDAVTTLAGSLGDTVPGSLKVSGSNLTVTLNPAQFLSKVTVVVTFTPSVANGELVLTPSAFQVGKFEMSADTIRQRFGGLAAGMLAPRTVCVASAFPKGLTLSGIHLSQQTVVADFSVDPGIATDPALQAKGTCG